MVRLARYRSKRDGTICTITAKDITVPTHCPVLGLPLYPGHGRAGPNSPSLDRIIPELGYTPGNVVVVSQRVNVLKRDSTIAEMRAIASFYTASTSARVTRGRPRKGPP
jgi:hypothetical protein